MIDDQGIHDQDASGVDTVAPPVTQPPMRPRIGWAGVGLGTAILVTLLLAPHGRIVLALAIIYTIVTVIHLSGFIVFGWLFGTRIEEIAVGFGPEIFRGPISGWPVSIRCIPGSGYVKFKGQDGAAPATASADSYNALRPWRRIILNLSGPAADLLAALLIMGLAAWPSFIHCFGQLFVITAGSRASAIALLEPFFRLLAQGGYILALGIVLTKQCATNLIPLPVTNGGGAAIELIQLAKGSPASPRSLTIVQMLGLVLLLGFVARMLYICFHTLRTM